MGTKVFLVILFAFGNASILKIDEDFKYQRISVEVSDKVPRHLCQNTLDRLEVRTQQFHVKSQKSAKLSENPYFLNGNNEISGMRNLHFGLIT